MTQREQIEQEIVEFFGSGITPREIDSIARFVESRLAEAQAKTERLKSQRAMTIARLEGYVEGYPTSEINFLQRIDELREIESVFERAVEKGAESVLFIRCTEHRKIPQLNKNEASGAECPICEFATLKAQNAKLTATLERERVRGDKGAFYRNHRYNLRCPTSAVRNGDCADPRHTWTDDQWLAAAREALAVSWLTNFALAEIEKATAADTLYKDLARRLIQRILDAADKTQPDWIDVELSLVRIIAQIQQSKEADRLAREECIEIIKNEGWGRHYTESFNKITQAIRATIKP